MSKRDVMHLERAGGRGESMNRLVDHLMKLAKDERFTVTVEKWEPLLPGNLMSRLHIPMRDIAEFTGHTEQEIKDAVKERFYPREIVSIGGREMEVIVSTRNLTPQQARKVEADIHNLARDIHCPLTQPKGNW